MSWGSEASRLARVAAGADGARRGGGPSGGIVWLEHLNIVVGDRVVAERFYFEEGLGLTRDPAKPGGATAGTMWANLGKQQLHLAARAADDPPQAVRGAIGLVLPKAAEAYERLRKIPEARVELHSDNCFSAQCPWGNVFHVYDVDGYRVHDEVESPKTTTKMAAMHKDDGRLTVRNGPGIRYLYVKCNDAKKVAQRYESFLGHRSQGKSDDEDLQVIDAGTGPVHFIFETKPKDPVADARMDGVHACIYVDNFPKRYDDLQDFVFTNPRFKHLDTCDTIEEALASRTFRFKLPDTLEHETRSLSHQQFLKDIVYHGPPPHP